MSNGGGPPASPEEEEEGGQDTEVHRDYRLDYEAAARTVEPRADDADQLREDAAAENDSEHQSVFGGAIQRQEPASHAYPFGSSWWHQLAPASCATASITVRCSIAARLPSAVSS